MLKINNFGFPHNEKFDVISFLTLEHVALLIIQQNVRETGFPFQNLCETQICYSPKIIIKRRVFPVLNAFHI